MASDREKGRARYTVQLAVRDGVLLAASSLACVDCGGSARDYDHHLGYEPEHALSVQPRCRPCHSKRHWRDDARAHKITVRNHSVSLPVEQQVLLAVLNQGRHRTFTIAREWAAAHADAYGYLVISQTGDLAKPVGAHFAVAQGLASPSSAAACHGRLP